MLAFVLPSACARSAEERQLDSMRSEIDRIAEDRDGENRDALPAAPASALRAPPAAPPLPGVMQLGQE
ncbi:MAG: hypothetical protein M3O36_15025, partial [Myxococcota bacterium]|nr:hypothetical protein [Myxococcota bacterium]